MSAFYNVEYCFWQHWKLKNYLMQGNTCDFIYLEMWLYLRFGYQTQIQPFQLKSLPLKTVKWDFDHIQNHECPILHLKGMYIMNIWSYFFWIWTWRIVVLVSPIIIKAQIPCSNSKLLWFESDYCASTRHFYTINNWWKNLAEMLLILPHCQNRQIKCVGQVGALFIQEQHQSFLAKGVSTQCRSM